MLFSIVIPAHNEEKYLKACIESCQKQQGSFDYEIIVVDNNSTDNTASVASSLGVKVVGEKKHGAGAARKKGVAEASGEYILNIDADTHLPSNYLIQVKKTFDKYKELVCLGGQFYFYDGTWWQNFFRPILLRLSNLIALLLSFGKVGPIASNMTFKKSVYDKTSGFDDSLQYGEDGNLTKKLSKFGVIKVDMGLKCFVSSRRFSRVDKNFSLYFLNAIYVAFLGRPYKNKL